MTRPRLTELADVSGPARLPDYIPHDHGVGIIHLGVGSFHRAHQAVMTDDALASDGGDWRIVGVSLRTKDIARDLNAQNGLYTLLERAATCTTARVIAAIDHVIAADPQATLAALCDPAIRIVTLTVTEAGYGIERDSRLPDTGNVIVAADLLNPANPEGVLGLLVAAIVRRREAGHKPFTVLSCDNLPENGELLRDGIVGFARSIDGDELANWIADNVPFPCSMVDRITPSPTSETRVEAALQTGCEDKATIETEPFSQWIIEDRFSAGRPRWEAGGALFVNDVKPYERMKLMMLNGCHSMLAYAGYLVGWRFVRDVMRDTDLSLLVQRHFKAASQLLQPLPGIDFNDYASALTDRFANPAIAHETYQIATDGTQKLPQRIFHPALEALNTQQDIRPFAFTAAMWMRFCQQRLDDGSGYKLRDPRSEEITTALGSNTQDAVDISNAFHRLPGLIPQKLACNDRWRQSVDEVLSIVLDKGCVAAIRIEADCLKTLRT